MPICEITTEEALIIAKCFKLNELFPVDVVSPEILRNREILLLFLLILDTSYITCQNRIPVYVESRHSSPTH